MPKGTTLHLRDLVIEKNAGKRLPQVEPYRRPKTRADCAQFERPCPFVACRHHLFLDVKPGGSISFPYGQDVAAIETMAHTCALDAAEQGEQPLRQIARNYGITHQAIRTVYWRGMANLGLQDAAREVAAGMDGCVNPTPRDKAPTQALRRTVASGKHFKEALDEP